MNIISAQNLKKYYGKDLALDDVSLHVKAGSVFALLGPNGAGKTTFVKSLLGLVRLKSGELLLNGKNVNDFTSRSGVAYLPEKFSFDTNYSVRGCVSFFGQMNGLSSSELEQRIDRALDLVGITDIASKKLDAISKGQLQRTGIATLLVSENSLLILDEPFSGLDPIGMIELKKLLAKLSSDESMTIFINSHILSEMDQICDSFAILNKGKIAAFGSKEELLQGSSLEQFFEKTIMGLA
ncbi:ABC transporter ATP-binding protein [Halobacteriovorax sp. HLS]|uniref:ABC transporter ATP-binding protein n=1 Tax=Halobacteriovorax sp. HLS TaxID=2234000 RepID=UPI000FDB0339|nr:ABC transporter ATP-binding protein [Halobacteriovorax sp. HLS]